MSYKRDLELIKIYRPELIVVDDHKWTAKEWSLENDKNRLLIKMRDCFYGADGYDYRGYNRAGYDRNGYYNAHADNTYGGLHKLRMNCDYEFSDKEYFEIVKKVLIK